MKILITILLIIVLPAKVGSQQTNFFDSLKKDTPNFLKVGSVKMPDLLRFDAIKNRMERKYQRYASQEKFNAWLEANQPEVLTDQTE